MKLNKLHFIDIKLTKAFSFLESQSLKMISVLLLILFSMGSYANNKDFIKGTKGYSALKVITNIIYINDDTVEYILLDMPVPGDYYCYIHSEVDNNLAFSSSKDHYILSLMELAYDIKLPVLIEFHVVGNISKIDSVQIHRPGHL